MHRHQNWYAGIGECFGYQAFLAGSPKGKSATAVATESEAASVDAPLQVADDKADDKPAKKAPAKKAAAKKAAATDDEAKPAKKAPAKKAPATKAAEASGSTAADYEEGDAK